MKPAAAPKAASQSLRQSIDLASVIRPFITTDVMQLTAVVVSAKSAVVQSLLIIFQLESPDIASAVAVERPGKWGGL